LDEVGQHLLGDLEVGDDAVLHRLDRHEVARCATEHVLRVLPDGLDPPAHLVDGRDRRLISDDPLVARVHVGIGRAQVDCQVTRKQRQHRTKTQTANSFGKTWPVCYRLETAAWIPFFPRSLTRYMAASAACTSSSAATATSGSVATPTDAVM